MDLSHGDARLIIDACKKNGLLRNQAAYVLATAFHETAHTMTPVREYGGETYLKSKPYYPFVGMGYVQLTWKRNYQKASDKLGVDFVKNPKLLLQAKYAAPILVVGMKQGWFTGKALLDYITLTKSDFIGARRIINGTDRASLIAGYAKDFDALLQAEGYGVSKPISGPPPLGTPIPGANPYPKPEQAPASPQAPKNTLLALLIDLFAFVVRLVKGKQQ